MVEALEVTSHLCFDHMMNGWRTESGEALFRRDYEGYQFPEEKETVLKLIEEGLLISESLHTSARDLMALPSL